MKTNDEQVREFIEDIKRKMQAQSEMLTAYRIRLKKYEDSEKDETCGMRLTVSEIMDVMEEIIPVYTDRDISMKEVAILKISHILIPSLEDEISICKDANRIRSVELLVNFKSYILSIKDLIDKLDVEG